MADKFVATVIRGDSKDTMGLVVPPEIVEALGKGKRPPVVVRLGKGGYAYRSTIASMGGQFLIGIAKEHREPAGIKNQKTIEVTLTLDTKPREVEVPKDLTKALSAAKVRTSFDALSFTRRKEAVRLVESAKAEATRERRVAKVVAELVAAAR
jgi:hypothetical protein